MGRRRALVVTFYLPEVDQDSGSRRVQDHVEFLCEDGWAVDVVALNGIRKERYARDLRRRGVAAHDGTATSLHDLVAAGHFDLALFAFWQTAEKYVPVLRQLSPRTRIVVDSIDLQFLRDARRILREPQSGLLDAGYASQLTGELNVYAAVDAVLTVSEKEAALINDLTAESGIASAVPDNEELALSPLSFAKRNGIVFVGSFSHAPNGKAVEYLCREVVPRLDPRLLQEHPLMIVGAGLDETIRAYGARNPDITMVGWVPSVVPYLERARISVVPLLYGAGTKRKLLQTLMVGTPAVSTSIGIEGLDLEHERHVLVADDPDVFAQAMIRLIGDRALWQALSRRGRRAIEQLHARAVVRDRFLAAVDTALTRRPKPALLPELSERDYWDRMDYLENQKIMAPIREAVRRLVPPDSTLAVVTNGSAELLRFPDRRAWPFPPNELGGHPGRLGSTEEALQQLEAVRERGADFLLLPNPVWWRDRYAEFIPRVESRYRAVVRCNAYVLYALREMAIATQGDEDSQPVASSIQVIAPRDEPVAPPNPPVRLIAFYLPQFHPIPENDEWWGEGFTEWNNVANAEPLFPGHYQPHIPADLGFYDLRLPDTRQAQAELAHQYGIHGFCYYHYWFGGKRLLERPFDEVLASGEPDFPFCLCWANEPWSRRWNGRPEDVLQPQEYSRKDDLAHIRWLLPALADPRAIRIEDKPVFVVYQGNDLPDPARTVEIWREEAERAGLGELFLMTVETGWDEGWDATSVGFDAKVMFRPQFTILRDTPRLEVEGPDELEVHDYEQAWPALAEPENVSYRRFETVCPRWDNTPRTGEKGVVLHDSTPAAYERWLSEAIERTLQRPRRDRTLFLNAWNEWAEGCHLEPDLEYGHEYLAATREALLTASGARQRQDGRPESSDAALLSPRDVATKEAP